MPETETTAALPERIPVFPLSGVLLLPGGRLPLNIFEERYLEMTRDAMATTRLIGMVQPEDPADLGFEPALYAIGCAGRITSFDETEDGRFLIVLTGHSRFRIAAELERETRYRQVSADWRPYAADLEPEDASGVDRERLLPALHAYLTLNDIEVDLRALQKAPAPVIINQMAMVCPFAPSEKQALLEAVDLTERGRVMTALVEMALLAHQGGGPQDAPH
jgi:Lon protease-like protein